MKGFNLIIKQDNEDLEAAEVLVDGTIGGKKYRFLLDTGAARTSVKSDDYVSAFVSDEKNQSSAVFAESQDDLITVPNIELGPISKKNFTLARMTGKNPAIRNLIGMDLLKDSCCHFFFDQNWVSVDCDDGVENSYLFKELFLDANFHPYMAVDFANATAQAVWDTGAGLTIADMSFIKKHPALFQEAGSSQGIDSTGTKVETPMFIVAESVIGHHEFPSHKVAGVDLSQVNSTIEVPMDLILGYNILNKANWLFDFPHKKWTISKHFG